MTYGTPARCGIEGCRRGGQEIMEAGGDSIHVCLFHFTYLRSAIGKAQKDGRMTGTIKRLAKDKGFGFIRAGSTDYFFHRSALKNGKWDDLEEGQEVTFEDVDGTKGPRAEDVYV